MTAFAVRTARRLLEAGPRLLTSLIRTLQDTWRQHVRLLHTHSGYAATIAAVAAALATHTEISDLLAALVGGVLAIYRTLRHHPDPDNGLNPFTY